MFSVAIRRIVTYACLIILPMHAFAEFGLTGGGVDVDDHSTFNHQFTQANGIRIHYVDEGEGPAVVLLHGFPLSWYSWRKQIPALVKGGYRVIIPDQRGYGETDRPDEITDYDISKLSGDIVALLNALDLEDAVLVGWDWGTAVAWTTALVRPDLVRGLGLVSTPYRPRGPVPPSSLWPKIFTDGIFYQQYFQEPGVADAEFAEDPYSTMVGSLYTLSATAAPEEQWRFILQEGETMVDLRTMPEQLPPWLSQRAADYYAQQFASSGFTGPLNWYRNLDRNWEITSFLAGAKIQQPTLFMAGEHDPGIKWGRKAFDALDETVPNLYRKALIAGAAHLAPEERPEEVNRLLLEFLESLYPQESEQSTE